MNLRYKNISFTAAGKAGVIEGPVEPPGPGQVLIRTRFSLTSPGTELAFFEGKHTSLRALAADAPRDCPGYSSTGTIETVGPGVLDWKTGELVACPGGHISYATVETKDLLRIPEGVSEEQAVFFMLGSIALHGARAAAPQFGENVLVLGLGAIGQIAVQFMRLTPAREIIVVDLFPFRREVARQNGATCALDPRESDFERMALDRTGGRGCEVVIEASGNTKAMPTALRLAAKRGRVLALGSPHGETTLDLYTDLHKKEVALIGCYQPLCPEFEASAGSWTQARNRALFLDYIRAKRLDMRPLITHRASYRDAQAVYDALSQGKDRSLTGLFDWTEP